ncbi:LuxR C-terminal-related transcriptional regulator [Candidatus Nephthysia bennettiae]|uniref:HTH luxR-type domain-containing protein n=1 Tax=Candidatus Nephthysia bennettiae TaxID=3127016 RepID=A0A934K575_9BACT|nr:hypothetical protein [Candidatus Dormibacteraeota bacterium]MBJ7614615.1 hypothetical protein [Candidatus Dormibacteraeota bacterium]PZS35138.1 MAG: hypothetical protein DLM58_04405 [Pseudonocardiales bacterium]
MARKDSKPYRLSWSLSSLALALALEGRLEEAEQLIAEAKRANPAYADAVLLEANATIQWLAGDFRGAVASWLESAAWNSGGESCRRGWAAAVAAIAAGELGSLAEAHHYLEHAARVYAGRGFYAWSQHVDWATGFMGWRTGEASPIPAFRRAADRWLAIGSLPNAAFSLLDLAESAALLGQPDAAHEAGQRLREVSDRIERPLYSAVASLGSAWAELSADRPSAALDLARKAAAVFAAARYRAFEARSLEVVGRALIASDRGAAAESLVAASAGFDALGAGWRRDRCSAVLSRLGQTGRRAASNSSAVALTAREAEVARLGAQGLTARDIGRQLFIGERTVETHLANVYVKLGLESKRELVLRAVELGLQSGTEPERRTPR